MKLSLEQAKVLAAKASEEIQDMTMDEARAYVQAWNDIFPYLDWHIAYLGFDCWIAVEERHES